MTWTEDQSGDRGQRYEVRATLAGQPQITGWADELYQAEALAHGICAHPAASEACVHDRLQAGCPIVFRTDNPGIARPTCPTCGMPMIHTRLRGYKCQRCG